MSANYSTLLPSEELADLHIFVVPVELWLEKYRTAFNNIALESVSAGFVRVLPYISLHALRDHIEEQLGADVVPEDYVFLRSVGRCLAVVKENQERLLKAKDFLPPMAYSPEIFVLSGTHDDVAKPVNNANTVIATHGITTAGMASTQQAHLPMIPPGYPQNPQLGIEALNSGYFYHQSGQMNVMHDSNRRENVRNPNQMRHISYESDDSGSSGGGKQTVNGPRRLSEDDGGNRSSENDGTESERKSFPRGKHVERVSDDEAETSAVDKHEFTPENSLSKTKKNKIQKKASSDSSGSSQSGQKTVKFIQPEVYQSLALPHPGGQFISPPTPIPSGRVISSPLPPQQTDQGPGSKVTYNTIAKGDRTEGGLGVENNLLSDRPKNVEQKVKKKKRRGGSRSPSGDTMQTKDKNSDYKTNTNNVENLMVHSEVTAYGSDSPPSLNEVEERSKFVQFPSPMKNNYDLQHSHEMEQEFVTSHLSGNLLDIREDDANNTIEHEAGEVETKDNKNTEKLDIVGHTNTIESLQGRDGQQETSAGKEGNKLGETANNVMMKHEKSGKGIPAEGKTVARKTVKKTAKKPSEDLDEKFKIPKVPTPAAVTKQPAQKRNKELEKDTASAKDRKHQELEKLKAELRKAKNDRVDMEKEREAKVRRAKMLQNQMLQRRNQAKNIWKKKFFDEKRKTAPLEEQVNRLRYEVDVQHKALMSYLESKEREGSKSQQGNEFKTPSEKTNQRMSLARLQHEVEELKSRIEELKVKLAAEMKKRDAAQKELKQIREDLMEKKINLTLTKSQKSLAALANPENITV